MVAQMTTSKQESTYGPEFRGETIHGPEFRWDRDHPKIHIDDHGNSIYILNHKDLPWIQYEVKHKQSIRQIPRSRYSGTNP